MIIKTYFIVFFIVLFTLNGFSQTKEEELKSWNSEVERVGNSAVKRIDDNLNTFKSSTKIITSKSYKNGKLTTFKEGKTIKKITKTYTIENVQYTENYYFHINWPIFVELMSSNSKASDKFYFDKTNLMLWTTKENKWLDVSDKNCADKWYELLDNIDRLKIIAMLSTKSENEDAIELPKIIPLSNLDSLEFIRLKEEAIRLNKELEKLMQEIPDSSKK